MPYVQVAAPYAISVHLLATSEVIGKQSVSVIPGPIHPPATVLISPPSHAVMTAGEVTTARLQLFDAFGNRAAPGPGVRLVVETKYISRGRWGPGAAPSPGENRIIMARQDEAVVYGPWVADLHFQSSGNVSARVFMEKGNGTILGELVTTALKVCSHSPKHG
jgi:hypothetical protein